MARNPNYWKPGRPYLDGIEYTIIPNRSTAILAFVSGKFDMTFPSSSRCRWSRHQGADAERGREIAPMNVAANLLMNPVPPFDDIEVRRAVAMTLDRKAFIDIMTQGQGDAGGAMPPMPAGRWGLPDEMLRAPAGLRSRHRQEPRGGAQDHGGQGLRPGQELKLKLSTRNLPTYRDAR